MARRDLTRQGSFRGVPFLWDDNTADIGRRIVKHEYPKRDQPYPEDMGRKADEFALDVYVLGDDWLDQKVKLIAAVRAAGAGKLVHPTMGEMQVAVTSCRLIERASTLGRCDFQIGFIEAGDVSFSIQTSPTPGAATQAAAAKANAASASSFAAKFSVLQRAQFAVTSALGTVKSALNKVVGSLGLMQMSSAIAGWQNQLSSIRGSLQTLFNLPSTLAGNVQSLIGGVSFLGTLNTDWSHVFGSSSASYSDVDTVRRTQLAIAKIGLTPLPTTVPAPPLIAVATADRLQEAANAAAVTALVRRAALAEAAQATVAVPYVSADQAQAARDEAADAIDAEILLAGATGDDAAFRALSDLRLAMVREVNAIAVVLPRLGSFTPVATLPAIVIAHRLYDDPTWEDDIVARNRVFHPGFVPGGQALQVLNNV